MNPEFKPGNELFNTASLLERQKARMKQPQQQQQQPQPQQQHFVNVNDHHNDIQNMFTSGLDVVKPENWAGFGDFTLSYGDQFGFGYMNTQVGADQSFGQPKKRKAVDKSQSQAEVVTEKEKKIKGCAEEGDSKITHQYSNNSDKPNDSKEASTNTSSKDKSKVSEVQKPDYIHVRARRGQATDSHSLAERVRREKISERMKYLQDLVPGCNKITGKAGMLDEIINYVQSLQKQVEFLSMKLATVNPELDFNVDNVFAKEMFQSSTSELLGLGCSSETANSGYFQINSLDQLVSYCGLDMGINSSEMALRRSISAPISIPETFMDSSCFNPTAMWDADLQNLYKMEFQQGTLIPFPSHQLTGSNEGSNLKTEK